MGVTAQEVVRNTTTLTSLPDNYTKLTDAIDRSSSSAKEIGEVVSRDTGLAARLLRIVNSAFYGFPTRVETISRAVTIVGTSQLKDLALATSVVKMFRSIPVEWLDMELFWRHSIATGVLARALAQARGESNVERFFLAGLLHDVGKLILLVKLPDPMRGVLEICQTTLRPQAEVEREVLGFSHAEVGFELLRTWKLAESLCEPVRCHHHPGRAASYPREAAAVHAACALANLLEWGRSGAATQVSISLAALEQLPLPVETLPALLDMTEAQYDDVVEIVLG